MLHVTIPKLRLWDEANEKFINIKEQKLSLEHSLVSLSKWESKWHKPFLSKKEKTREEERDYVRCMTISQNIDPNVYAYIPDTIIDEIIAYINDPMTATTISNQKNVKNNGQTITSELIYSWMIALHIPAEYQKWHLNRLLTLIELCGIQNQPKKKMSTNEVLSQQARLNAKRRKALKSKG